MFAKVHWIKIMNLIKKPCAALLVLYNQQFCFVHFSVQMPISNKYNSEKNGDVILVSTQ